MKTLYLVRKSPDQIPSSIFLPSQTEGDVLLMEGSTSSVSYTGGRVFSTAGENQDSHVSYDNIISMLFEYDNVIVL